MLRCYFKLILEAALFKASAIYPLTSYLTNYRFKDELVSDILLQTHTIGLNNAGSSEKTYIYQFSADTGFSLEGLLGALLIGAVEYTLCISAEE